MTVIAELNNLLHFNKKLSKKLEKLFQNNFTYKEYVELKNHIIYRNKYFNPKHNYDDFEKQREMVKCILYSTIGQESQDWIKEWSDIFYKIFTGAEPNCYEYEVIKLFVENYYHLMKETGRLKLFVNESYYLYQWQQANQDKKWQFEQDLRVYEEVVENIRQNIRKLA